MRQFIVLFFATCIIFGFLAFNVFSRVTPGEKDAPAESFDFPRLRYDIGDLRDPFGPQIFLPEPEKIEPDFPVEVVIPEEITPVRQSITELFPIILQGVIWNTDRPLAIIGISDNQIVVEKQQDLSGLRSAGIPGEMIKILDISESGVVILYEGEAERLPLPGFMYLPNKENSKKGEK